MGMGYVLKCSNDCCEYERMLFAGVGIGFPETYNELMKDAKAGKISEAHTEFLKENPEGALNAEVRIYQCSKCGHIYTDYDLSMYVRREDYGEIPPKGRWSVAFPAEGVQYVAPYELSEFYRLYKEFPHHCPDCGGKAVVLDVVDQVSEKCPECGSELTVDTLLWD